MAEDILSCSRILVISNIMLKTLKGSSKIKNKKIAVVVSRFNEFITQKLLEGCLKEFELRGQILNS